MVDFIEVKDDGVTLLFPGREAADEWQKRIYQQQED